MPKKILFRLRSMEMGGVQKVLLDLLNRLDKDKFEVSLLLTFYQGALKNEIPTNINLCYLEKGKEELSPNPSIHYLQLIVRRINVAMYQIFPLLLKKKLGFVPDVEIAFMSSNLPDLLNSPFKKSKKINWFHSDIRFFKPQKLADKTLDYMAQCDKTVFVSKATHNNVKTFTNGLFSNGVCINNIFDFETIKLKASQAITNDENLVDTTKPTFISVGRLVYQKGYDILLEAHIELIREGYNHQIIIVGDGEDAKKINEKAILENVADSFILAGQKENPYPYIAAADYYIQPSRYESYPLAIGEALILNKPIISTDAGGIHEIITHNETGLIVDFSKDSLKKSIITFLDDSELINRMKKNQKMISFEIHNQYVYRQIENLLLN